MARLLCLVLLTFWGQTSLGAQTLTAEEIGEEFARLAEELRFLSASSIIYDRIEGPGAYDVLEKQRYLERHFRVLSQVTRGFPKEELLILLRHENPKVRTLAAAALFDLEDPSVLPHLVPLIHDDAVSIKGPSMSAAPRFDLAVLLPRQTVGEFVSSLVAAYMKSSGFFYGVKHKSEPGFEEYWQARKDRSHTAGWFAVKLARASQGTIPTPEDRYEQIRKLREEIDQLPEDERTWILLWLNGEPGSEVLVTESELVAMSQKLGPDRLLAMLENQIPSDDPDLQPRRNNNWPYRQMVLFVLRHADQLLRSEDSEVLLAREQWHWEYQEHGIVDPTLTAWWAIAAANLNPGQASQILHGALTRYQRKYQCVDRIHLYMALWRHFGRQEANFVTDGFYEDRLKNCRDFFFETIEGEANGRELLAHLVRDSRLHTVEWRTLDRLVQVVNRWSATPVVTEEELRKAWHPLGDSYHRSEKAKTTYPDETAELEAHLCVWRERLQASIPSWFPDS